MGSGCLLLKKLIKRPDWWKRKFSLFLILATRGRAGQGGQVSVQRPTPFTDNQWGNSLYRLREGLQLETAQSAPTVMLKLSTRGLTSVTLMVLGAVDLQFQGRFVPVSLRPVLRIVAVYVTATAWSSCS